MGDVVAQDDDLVDGRGRPLADGPPEVDDGGAVGGRAARLLGLDLGVDVAGVGVQVPDVVRGLLPGGAVERGRGHGFADPAAEGVVGGELVGREPPVPHDVEGADLVHPALVHGEPQDRLLRARLGHQGVGEDLEVHQAAGGIERREPVAQVGLQSLLVVLALPEPPEALGLRGHAAHDLLVGEALVALDLHPAHRHPVALQDVEEHAHAALGGLDDGLDPGGVVPPLPVEGVDGEDAPGEGVPVEGAPLLERHPVADGAGRDPLGPAHRPALEQRPLDHPEDEHQAALVLPLLDDDVVELAGGHEGGDGPLDVAVVDRGAARDAGGAEHLAGGEAGVPLDGEGVHDDRRDLLRRGGPRAAREGGGEQRDGEEAADRAGRCPPGLRRGWA